MAERLSFKNVGVRADIARRNILNRASTTPIGIKTPLELSGGKSLFVMNTDVREQIKDNLRNLLFTNHGERLMFNNFGANLRPLLTEYTNKEDFDSEAMVRINTAISTYMPFITPLAFESSPSFVDNQFTGQINIIMVYSVPALQLVEDALEIKLFII